MQRSLLAILVQHNVAESCFLKLTKLLSMLLRSTTEVLNMCTYLVFSGEPLVVSWFLKLTLWRTSINWMIAPCESSPIKGEECEVQLYVT